MTPKAWPGLVGARDHHMNVGSWGGVYCRGRDQLDRRHWASVLALDHGVARTLGRMLGESGTADPIDAHLVLLARDEVGRCSPPTQALCLPSTQR
jgi:hypothetical protein